MDNKFLITLIGAVVAVGCLLVLILVPISFSYLEFHQYGFKRTRITGAVDISTVYGPGGRHMLGPGTEFKTFQADAHFVSFPRVTVFTSDKLEVTISADLQYFLKEEDLPSLHKQYDIYYEPILKRNAQDALKGAATVYSKNEFIKDRKKIENSLFNAVSGRLGGKCCIKDCGKKGTCRPGCIPYSSCKVTDKGLFAEVRYFQLLDVDIPSDVSKNYLNALLLNEQAEKETYVQNYTVVQKQTYQLTERIENQANEVSRNATAEAKLIRSRADANAAAILEKARSEGLRKLYNKLSISQPQHKSSFDYLRTLKEMPNAHLSVDFDQLIAGKL